jgi:peptidoglycan/LPS O-acetylase OafA/YrhL
LWVFFHHAAIRIDPLEIRWHESLHTQGMLGVAIFFVLSGLLLTIPFWQALCGQRTWPIMSSYATARLGRVVPAYLVCLLGCWLLAPSSPDRALRIGTAVTFTNWIHWRTFFPSPINAALWSIGIEVCFYALLPLWALGLKPFKKPLGWAFYWMVTQLVIIGVQVLVLNRIDLWTSDTQTADPLQNYAQGLVPSKNPLGLFSHFLFGSAAAGILIVLWKPKEQAESSPGHWNRFDILGLACVACLAIQIHPKSLPVPQGTAWIERAQVWAMHYQWPLFPAVTAALLLAMHRSKILGRIFDNRVLSGICTLSYGIYLWHMVVLELFCKTCPWTLGTLPRQIAASLVSLAITVVLAGISYKYIEVPAMNLIRRRSSRAPDPQPGEARSLSPLAGA